MSRLLPMLSLALLCACRPPADEPDTAVPEPTGETRAEYRIPPVPGDGIDAERYAGHVRVLSSDEFEGRAPGTRGERLTLDYLITNFSGLGLLPGYGDSYLQPVPMVEIHNEHRSSIEVDFDAASVTLQYPEQMIIGSRRLGPEAHGVDNSELVFAGYGVVAPEYGWNDYAGLDVNGKTVIVLVNDPGYATGDEALFNGRAMTYYGRWTYKYEEAARQGAAAALIVHETEPASYPWEVVINSWSGVQFELADRGDEPVMALEGWITVDAARDLFERAGLDFESEKARAAEPGFTARFLNASMRADVQNRTGEGVSYNVLARIPGRDRPDEAVIYMAHWDHLGRDPETPGSEGIYNGAVDNASGVAGLLEIARLFTEAGAPERSVLFLAVTLEESGLLGSRHYVNNPAYPPSRTAAAINMDAIRFVGPTRDVEVIGHGSSELEDILAAAAAGQDRVIVSEPTPESGFYYRSDHFNFAHAGIPALYAKDGVEHREHGREFGLEARRDYTADRYHKPADEFNPDWDFRGVVEDLELLYQVGRYVADSEDWPRWYPGSEFRAIRDAQGR